MTTEATPPPPTHAIECNWQGNMAFELEVDGHKIAIDAAPEHGGEDRGPKPKPLLLASLAGCTGMDVVAILAKMRQPVRHFRVHVEGDLTEGYPAVYSRIRIVYELSKADGLDPERVQRAVNLSKDKYCGVSAMLRKAADLSFEIRYID